MAAKKQKNRLGAMLSEVEPLAKRLQTDIRKRAEAAGFLKHLRGMAAQLRKQAARAAKQVEGYAHQVRKDLEVVGKLPKPARQKKVRPKMRKPAPAAPPVAF